MNHPTESYRSLWRSTRAFAALPIAVLAFGHEATAGTAAVNLSHTGGSQDWTVPAGITSVSVTLTGAKGGRGSNDGPGNAGNPGTGGRVTGSLAVTPGELLTAHVGGAGQNGSFATNTGGGAGGSYGGARGGHAGLLQDMHARGPAMLHLLCLLEQPAYFTHRTFDGKAT